MSLKTKLGRPAQKCCDARQRYDIVWRFLMAAALMSLIGGLVSFIPLPDSKSYFGASATNAVMHAGQAVHPAEVKGFVRTPGLETSHTVFGLESSEQKNGADSAVAAVPDGNPADTVSVEGVQPGKAPFRITSVPAARQAVGFGFNGQETVRPPAPVPKGQHPALRSLTMADFPALNKSQDTLGQNEISENGLYSMFAQGSNSIGWVRGVDLSPDGTFTDRHAVKTSLPSSPEMIFGSSMGTRPDGKRILFFADEGLKADGPISSYLAVDGEQKLWKVSVPAPVAETGLFSVFSPQIAPNGSLWQEMFSFPRRHHVVGEPTDFAVAAVLPAEQENKLGPLSPTAVSTIPGYQTTFKRQNISTVWDKSGNFYQPAHSYGVPGNNVGVGADIFRFDVSRYPEKLSYTPLDSLRSDRIVTKNGEYMREHIDGLGLVGWHQNRWWMSTKMGSRWSESGIFAVDPITGAVVAKNIADTSKAGYDPAFTYLRTGLAREFSSSGELVPSVLLDVDHEINQLEAALADTLTGRVTVKNIGGGGYTGSVAVDLSKLLPYADYAPQGTRLRILDVNGNEYSADVDWLEGPVGGSVAPLSGDGRLTWQGTIPSDARLVWEYQLRAKGLGSEDEAVTASAWTPETDQDGEPLISRCSDSYQDHEVVPGVRAKQQCSAGVKFVDPSTLEVTKTGNVSDDGVATYKVTAKNNGSRPRNIADMRDDMSGVLSQSVYKGVVSITVVDAADQPQNNDVKVQLSGKVLEFTGSIDAGHTLRVVYQVQLMGKGQKPP